MNDERFRGKKFYTPRIMLLIGIWISFTKNPMKPMIENPMRVARAIELNSKLILNERN
jgi:hypothetical protein